MPEVVLRPAEEEDIAEMLALYAPYVVQTTVSSEYDAPSMEEFTRRWRTYTQKLPWLVCRIDGEVVGYGYAAPHRTRAAYQRTAACHGDAVGGNIAGQLGRCALEHPVHRLDDR